MTTHPSPLRYPGGKTVLTPLLSNIILDGKLQDCTYAEPFAGGAGAALKLLFGEYVQDIYLNDLDIHIYAFWRNILTQTDQFLSAIENVPVTMEEWYRQKAIFDNPTEHTSFDIGFATFFLNRTNRSGILMKGGPIGGFQQSGRWTIFARFNKDKLIKKIQNIEIYKDRIFFSNLDAIDFLRKIIQPLANEKSSILVYLDPPYYTKGQSLYMNHLTHDDHASLANYLETHCTFNWIMTYDESQEIRKIYKSCEFKPFYLRYSAAKKRKGSELFIYDSQKLQISKDVYSSFPNFN